MFNFKKRQIKLNLIQDYIKIVVFKNFFDNDFTKLDEKFVTEDFNFTKNKVNDTFLVYDKILKKLKLNDLSLLILKKDLKQNNIMYEQLKNKNFSNLQGTLNIIQTNINKILIDLSINLKVLKLNPTIIANTN